MAETGQMQSNDSFDIFNVLLLQNLAISQYQHSNILETDKKFHHKEIGESIIPFFYYTTVMATPIIFTMLRLMSPSGNQVIMALLPLLSSFLLFFGPIRKYTVNENGVTTEKTSFWALVVAILTYIFGSFAEVIRSISAAITVNKGASQRDHKTPTRFKGKTDCIKALGSWIAQDIVLETGSYWLLHLASFTFYSIALSMVLYNYFFTVAMANAGGSAKSMSEIFAEIGDGFAKLTKNQKMNLMLQVCNNSLRLFLGLFMHIILTEIKQNEEARKKIEGVNETNNQQIPGAFSKIATKFNEIIYYIIHAITLVLIFITFTKRKGSAEDRAASRKKNTGVGYIMGVVKVLAIFLVYLVTAYCLDPQNFFTYLFYTMPLTLALITLLARARTIFMAKFVYFIIHTSLMLNDAFLVVNKQQLKAQHLFLCFIPFLVGLFNTSVNVACQTLKLGIKIKCMLYTIFGIGIYLIALLIKNTSIWDDLPNA